MAGVHDDAGFCQFLCLSDGKHAVGLLGLAIGRAVVEAAALEFEVSEVEVTSELPPLGGPT